VGSLSAIRRALFAKGFTALPVCVRCNRQTQVRHWGQNQRCAECDAAVAFVDAQVMQIDRRLTELWAAGREGFGTEADQDEIDALELERYNLLAPTSPEPDPAYPDTGPDGLPAFPVEHPPVADTSPFLPEDDEDVGL
jgi:hypothetical protein